MISTSTELVQYSKATEIAAKYAAATAEIRRLALELGTQTAALQAAFASECGYSFDFDVELTLRQRTHKLNEAGADAMLSEMKRSAWGVLVEKLGIKKLMSPKKRDELANQLAGISRGYGHDKPEELPEISAESIISVLTGFIESAPDFIEDSIREVYKWLIPCHWEGGHVTNKRDRVGKKVIHTYCVEEGFSRAFRVCCRAQGELTALDAVMHTLDGKGIVGGHYGPLVSAIETTETGTGETEYFKFKAFKNGNLHLEFKRIDLLDLFNRISCDGHRLGAEAARKRSA
jgi:hypothetical protein